MFGGACVDGWAFWIKFIDRVIARHVNENRLVLGRSVAGVDQQHVAGTVSPYRAAKGWH